MIIHNCKTIAFVKNNSSVILTRIWLLYLHLESILYKSLCVYRIIFMCRHRGHNTKAFGLYPFWIYAYPDEYLDQRRRENNINTSWSYLYWFSPEGSYSGKLRLVYLKWKQHLQFIKTGCDFGSNDSPTVRTVCMCWIYEPSNASPNP